MKLVGRVVRMNQLTSRHSWALGQRHRFGTIRVSEARNARDRATSLTY